MAEAGGYRQGVEQGGELWIQFGHLNAPLGQCRQICRGDRALVVSQCVQQGVEALGGGILWIQVVQPLDFGKPVVVLPCIFIRGGDGAVVADDPSHMGIAACRCFRQEVVATALASQAVQPAITLEQHGGGAMAKVLR
ncbi:hypothetical protein D3C78_1130150 [compost metagenome]